jgi:hypothetical protein
MLTKADIQTIVDRDNLVVRNLQITQGYHRLSKGMKRWMSSKNVSWCAFATHASKTAGQALRHELMPRILKSAMIRMAGFDNTYFFLNGISIEPNQDVTIDHSSKLGQALKRVSLLVSEGNVMVFKELAWPFANLVTTFSSDWSYDAEKLQAFLEEHFKWGPLEEGGQDYLIEAFTMYYNARYETNSKRKAEYVLQGNLLIGLHEQTRLQSQIDQALAVPFDIFLPNRVKGPRGVGKRFRKRGTDLSRKMATRMVTQMMMLITLPNRELKLGNDVIAPTGVNSFPLDLLTIEDPRCRALVQQFDVGLDTLSGSAAENWASLKDRMSFVVDFFRAHQQNKRLFEAPFLDGQVPAIDAGYMPAGPL